MLHADGSYALPKNVPANQFLNLEGRKFSKSKGWVIEQHEYLNDFAAFPNAADALRYVLARNAPEQKDGDFKWDDFVAAYDNELADNLGNFLNRVMSFAYKYFEGKVPKYDADLYADERAELAKLLENVETAMTAYRFKDAVQAIMEISRFGNGFLQEKAPWLLHKANPEDVNIANCIGFALQIAASLGVLTSVFIPFAAEKIRKMLKFHYRLTTNGSDWRVITEFLAGKKPILEPAHQLGEQQILFPKINDKKNPQFMQLVDAQKAKLETLKKSFLEAEKVAAAKIEAEKAAEAAKNKPNIEFPDFEKLDLRVGTITAAERVPKSDKLLKLNVDLGDEQRTVVSGIALSFAPEQVIGQQVTLVANLAPRKMMGIMSQGMILMATDAEGKLVFASPTRQVPNGGIVK
jgi:methionyl-tRNA synthetase